MMPWLRAPRRLDGRCATQRWDLWSQQARCGKGYKLPKEIKRLPTVAKDMYNTGKSQVPPTKHQRQAVKERTKEHDVAEAAHLDPKYWRSTSDDEEKRA